MDLAAPVGAELIVVLGVDALAVGLLLARRRQPREALVRDDRFAILDQPTDEMITSFGSLGSSSALISRSIDASDSASSPLSLP